MYVACPSCKALYPVSADYLRLADGQVRCSACQTRFDASSAVFDDPQQALDYEYPLQPVMKGEIDDLVGRALDNGKEEASVVEVTVSTATHAAADYYAWPVSSEFCESENIELVSPEPEPVPVPEPESEPDSRVDLSHEYLLEDAEPVQDQSAWGAMMVALLLTAGLIVQYAYVERYQLVQIAGFRPVIEMLCMPLNCNLPLRRDLARVEMIEREVRQHPSVDDALLVQASFINRADFVQAYPLLQISFSDVSGTPIAVRQFRPNEYLRGRTGLADGISPGKKVLVMLEVVDPGDRVVSFQFDFM